MKEPLYRRELQVPREVTVTVDGMRVVVEGPRGRLERDFGHAQGIVIRREDSKVIVETFNANRRRKALVGTVAAHIRNMIIGVTRGYRYKLKIIFTHFPISVEVKGNQLLIKNFLGEKGVRKATILDGVKVSIEGTDIIVEGIDVERVGQTAANIEHATKIKDLDRRVFADGIYIYERGLAE